MTNQSQGTPVDQPKKSKRYFIKRHKELLAGVTPEQEHGIRLLIHKLYRDQKSVSSKRGSKNFDLNRWIKSNINGKDHNQRM